MYEIQYYKYIITYFLTFSCVPGVFGNQQPNYLDLIKQMLQLSVNDASNYEVSLTKKFKKCFSFVWRSYASVI